MRLFPSERARQRRDTRTVIRFFAVMAIVTLAFAVICAARYLIGWW